MRISSHDSCVAIATRSNRSWLYLKIHQRAALPLGLYGALLPVLLVPSGVTLARAFGVFRFEAALTVPFAAIVITAYYLVWKHIVAYLNHEMGIG